MEDAIVKAIERVEMKFNTAFDAADIVDALMLTVRKMQVKQKGESYFPLLFETELEETFIRREINRMGEESRCAAYA